MSLLDVQNLSVRYATRNGVITAVGGITLSVARGECLAIVGESGSGKSQTCLATMGLTGDQADISGSVLFEGRDILSLPPIERRRLYGRRMSMIFQNPKTSLTPHLNIGKQLDEALKVHGIGNRRTKAIDALSEVRIADPVALLKRYPFELSGGMNQRVGIAMALIAEPNLVIADEPTTALDVTVQSDILSVLKQAQAQRNLGLIFITHDMAVVSKIADRVAVVYAGRIVERGPANTVIHAPRHPYTQALIEAAPRLGGNVMNRLPAIPGQPPKGGAPKTGCAFAPRCPQRFEPCDMRPKQTFCGTEHSVACHLLETEPS